MGDDAEGHLIFTTPPDPAPAWVEQHMLSEAEEKAARALTVPVEAVVLGAWKAWGCSLTEERERRFAAHPGRTDNARRAQAVRGHLTRALLAELRPLLAGVRRARPRPKRRRSR